MEAWHASVSFPQLTELYFAFNLVNDESALIPAVTQNQTLTFLVITGNPFAVNLQNSTLEILLAERYSRGGQLVNESLNPPTYLKGSRTKTAPESNQLFQNMMNYGQSKGLVQVAEANTYQGNDPFVLGKPLAIEFNPNAFEEHNGRNQDSP